MFDLFDIVGNLGAKGEWLWGGFGKKKGPGGKPGYDCSGLITAGLKRLGCKFNGRFTTNTFLKNKRLFQPITNPNDLKKGDILVFDVPGFTIPIINYVWREPGKHSGVVEWFDPNTGNGLMYCARASSTGKPFGHYRFGPWAAGTTDYYFAKFTAVRPTLKLQCPRKPRISAPGRKPSCKDPLVLNLDGNGVNTLSLTSGVCFDYEGSGFRQSTGWVAPGNGVLFLDKEGTSCLNSGNDLIGSLQELAQFDSNQDGKIDSEDPVWCKLRVWQIDTSTDADLGDPDSSGMVSTLDQLGIIALNLGETATTKVDVNGNTELSTGSFLWANGSTGAIVSYQFQWDSMDTVPVQELDLPEDIQALPELTGYGNVYDLHQAMVRDPTGQLKALVEQFASEEDIVKRQTILDQIINGRFSCQYWDFDDTPELDGEVKWTTYVQRLTLDREVHRRGDMLKGRIYVECWRERTADFNSSDWQTIRRLYGVFHAQVE